MSPLLVYYISGHGFGHARRSVQIIHHLLELNPQLHVNIRASCPPPVRRGRIQVGATAAGGGATDFIFQTLPKNRISIHQGVYDAGCVESDTLTINPEKTLDGLRDLLTHENEIIDSEIRELQPLNPLGIISDISFFPAAIAQKLNIPAIAASNFSWDWIYEPFLSAAGVQSAAGVLTGEMPTAQPGFPQPTSASAALLHKISTYYSLFNELLAMPFTGISNSFKKITPVPLVAVLPTLSKQQVLQKLPPAYKDPRFKLLIGLRGGCSIETLKQVALNSPDILFTVFFDLPKDMPDNIIPLIQTPDLDFSDVLQISDAVMSKPGYGMLADCCALGVDLVGPTRAGFREDEISIPIAQNHIRHSPMTRAEYESGHWRRAIDALRQMPKPLTVMDSTGAQVCAQLITRRIL